MLQDITNRSSEVGFHKAKKKERKKRAVVGGRIIFRPTIYLAISIRLQYFLSKTFILNRTDEETSLNTLFDPFKT